MHVRCAGHILNLIVREGLKEQVESILRIRNAVRYVKSSPNRETTFKSAKAFTQNPCKKSLVLDVDTRWNSTYDMLEVAEVYEDVFHLMARIDNPYKKYFSVGKDNYEDDNNVDERDLDLCEEEDKNKRLKTTSDRRIGPPTPEDFAKARSFVKFLKIFFDVTVSISGSNYVTVNNLFLHIIGVHSAINSYISQVDDHLLSSMACRMKEKFVKYWGKMRNQNLLLYIDVVLDPRYKLKLISYCLEQVYEDSSGEVMTQIVRDELQKLFDQYELSSLGIDVTPARTQSVASTSKVGDNSLGALSFLTKGFAEHLEMVETKESNYELNRYLSDCYETSDSTFDVLTWWKVNSRKFPILSKMDKDVLAIPVSTVASEAAFSTSGRVIDPYRSRLAPSTIEALIFTQNWLRTRTDLICLRTVVEDVEEREGEGTMNEKECPIEV